MYLEEEWYFDEILIHINKSSLELAQKQLD